MWYEMECLRLVVMLFLWRASSIGREMPSEVSAKLGAQTTFASRFYNTASLDALWVLHVVFIAFASSNPCSY